MRFFLRFIGMFIAVALASPAMAQESENKRDEFFWMGEINKASTVMTVEQGIVPKSMAARIAQGVAYSIEQSSKPDGKRPKDYVQIERIITDAAGPDASRIHSGRSRQDIYATFHLAILRDMTLDLAESMNKAREALLMLASKHVNTLVPGYTNGVQAQPTTYAHFLLAYAAAFDRDAERLRETYSRLNRSPLGTAVMINSAWPLNRKRLAELLGFDQLVENSYDAGQLTTEDLPLELSSIAAAAAMKVGGFIQDMHVQYHQTRPWLLLEVGATYTSSAMPQKRNPGILMFTREAASNVIMEAQGVLIRAHNVNPGMTDYKTVSSNGRAIEGAKLMFDQFAKILGSIVVNPQRALEELNADWTTSMELADTLQRKYDVPFRVGHHFASEIVTYARSNNIKPLDFPYTEAVRIYGESTKLDKMENTKLPLSEAEFRATLSPENMVKTRVGVGGPQPEEVNRMLAEGRERVNKHKAWTTDQRAKLAEASARLNAEFRKLLDHNK